MGHVTFVHDDNIIYIYIITQFAALAAVVRTCMHSGLDIASPAFAHLLLPAQSEQGPIPGVILGRLWLLRPLQQ